MKNNKYNFSGFIEMIRESISEQENPDKRLVRHVEQIKGSDGLFRVYVISDFETFAEERKLLFKTIKEIPERCVINISETDFIKRYYGSDFDELVRSLEVIYSEKDNSEISDDGCTYFKRYDLSDYIEGLANISLITNQGKCNWENINALRKLGYNIFSGEKDSFGWLTGCIQKKNDNRILVYG